MNLYELINIRVCTMYLNIKRKNSSTVRFRYQVPSPQWTKSLQRFNAVFTPVELSLLQQQLI